MEGKICGKVELPRSSAGDSPADGLSFDNYSNRKFCFLNNIVRLYFVILHFVYSVSIQITNFTGIILSYLSDEFTKVIGLSDCQKKFM